MEWGQPKRSSGSLVCGDVCGNTGMKAALTLLCRDASVTPGLGVNHAPNTVGQDRTELEMSNTSNGEITTVSTSKASLVNVWRGNIVLLLGAVLAVIVVARISFRIRLFLRTYRRHGGTAGVLRQVRGPTSGPSRRRRRHEDEDDNNCIEMVEQGRKSCTVAPNIGSLEVKPSSSFSHNYNFHTHRKFKLYYWINYGDNVRM
ncbi:hypothetical protein Bbelb_142270 [Branchiostoma belcheri]|nr:hypothetical protein Bbelb_142270 [Branchiostoma belcheri]